MLLLGLGAGILSGCGEDYTHGYVQSEDSIQQITPGSSREQVLLVLGSPSTTSTIGGDAFYYITQKTARSLAFMEPGLVDQRVLAVYFDEKGQVKQVANYGMQDGKIFDFISRKTKTTGQDIGFIGQMFRGGTSFGPALPGAK
jgi:outer membrane protein assembly factor BamE (lipoprotein component of BamABCDE complex)